MWCKDCNVVMSIAGTTYQKKEKDKHNKDISTYKRYNECPKCHDKIYNNSGNFQEILLKVSEKCRNI